jgi:glycerol-3-phosphate dehydrogenase (NAD(P)+)
MAEHPLSAELARISVLGGGAWGTALALHCGRKGHEVLVWAREEEVVEGINQSHENHHFFPGFQLPASVCASTDAQEVAKFGDLILVVIPTPFVERVMEPLKDVIRDDQIVCSCTKGILNNVSGSARERVPFAAQGAHARAARPILRHRS